MTVMNASYGAVGCSASALDEVRDDAGQPAQRRVAFLEVLTGLAAGVVVLIGREALGGVREHELVRLLDGVDPRAELGDGVGLAHAWPAGFALEPFGPTGQRLGSWCSRYWRRVMKPKIIDLVIHHFSGRTAK